MKWQRYLIFGVMAIAFSGCLTPYVLPKNVPTAKLNLSGSNMASYWICANDERQSLTKDKSGYATIAANQRVIVGASFTSDQYNVSYSCDPRSSFVPDADKSYFLDFQIELERCSAFVYREGALNPAGLDFDSTFRRGGSCGAR